MRNWFKSPYNIFLTFLLFVNGLPFLAPIFLKLSEVSQIFTLPANAIYFLYSMLCHQFHHRSIHLFDNQLAWCTRDVGIWMGMLIGAVAIKYLGVKGIKWYWVIPFTIPIALDGGIQTVATFLEIGVTGATGDPLYISNNLARFVTGMLFGLGASLWLSQTILNSLEPNKSAQPKLDIETEVSVGAPGTRLFAELIKTSFRRVSLLFAGLILVYVGLVGLWDITSQEYLPSDALDTAVKTPATDFFERRVNGACPAGVDDILALDCFF